MLWSNYLLFKFTTVQLDKLNEREIQWNLVNPVTNGPQKSGCINMMAIHVLKGYLNKKNDWCGRKHSTVQCRSLWVAFCLFLKMSYLTHTFSFSANQTFIWNILHESSWGGQPRGSCMTSRLCWSHLMLVFYSHFKLYQVVYSAERNNQKPWIQQMKDKNMQHQSLISFQMQKHISLQAKAGRCFWLKTDSIYTYDTNINFSSFLSSSSCCIFICPLPIATKCVCSLCNYYRNNLCPLLSRLI